MKPSFKKGFSIIELIFVIAVLGIIAAVAVPKLMDARSSAIVSTIKQDISTITSSVQSYYMLHDKIDKISDSVNINESTWDVTDTEVSFSSEENECILIALSDNELNLTINPNPSQGFFQISSSIFKTGNTDILVYSIDGKVLLHENEKSRCESSSIDLSSMQNGLYFLKLQNGKHFLKTKVVIAK